MISIFNMHHKPTEPVTSLPLQVCQSYINRFEHAVRNLEMITEEERRERNKEIHRRFSNLLFI
ncbi:MAG: hypothetical protein NZM38_04995 [Cytophagales bacterium]|nr:hypothetical protein [Cytophagales bacterium]MDW8384109.1 hypothetical protein [Flammeovirgaceae bacterium]